VGSLLTEAGEHVVNYNSGSRYHLQYLQGGDAQTCCLREFRTKRASGVVAVHDTVHNKVHASEPTAVLCLHTPGVPTVQLRRLKRNQVMWIQKKSGLAEEISIAKKNMDVGKKNFRSSFLLSREVAGPFACYAR